MTFSPTSLPPERLGSLLRSARRHAQLSRRRAANIASVTTAHLIAIERGWETVTEETLATLLDTYGTTAAELIPARSPLSVIGSVVHSGDNVQVAASTASDDVLRAYLALVIESRAQGTIEPLTLRADDIAALSDVLEFDESVLTRRIATLLQCDEREARSLARELLTRVAAPVLGVALSAAALGGLTGDTASADAPATNPTTATVAISQTARSTVPAQAPETIAATSTDVVVVSAPPVVEAPSTTAPAAPATVGNNTPSTTTPHETPAPAPADASPASNSHAFTQPSQPTPTTLPAPDTGVLPGETPSEIFYGG